MQKKIELRSCFHHSY